MMLDRPIVSRLPGESTFRRWTIIAIHKPDDLEPDSLLSPHPYPLCPILSAPFHK
jgi:hypothetical protein